MARLETGCPAIAKRAKVERAVIHWCDEPPISNQDRLIPGGQSQIPTVARNAERTSKSMFSEVGNHLNGNRLIAFPQRPIEDAVQKIFLIVANL